MFCAFDKQQNPKRSRHFRDFKPRVASRNHAPDEESRLADAVRQTEEVATANPRDSLRQSSAVI